MVQKSKNFAGSKGRRGEQEINRLLQPVIDSIYSEFSLPAPQLYRNKNQSHKGGYDIDGISWLAIEVKFQETFNLSKWWEQTLSQASEDQVPVLIYKKAYVKWRVRMFGYLDCGDTRVKAIVDISIDDFLTFLYYRLKDDLTKSILEEDDFDLDLPT